jgi:hypothetical protein
MTLCGWVMQSKKNDLEPKGTTFSLTLNMKALHFFEMSGTIHPTTQRHIAED